MKVWDSNELRNDTTKRGAAFSLTHLQLSDKQANSPVVVNLLLVLSPHSGSLQSEPCLLRVEVFLSLKVTGIEDAQGSDS